MADLKETSQAWKQLSRASWQRRILPGIAVIGLVVLTRTLGFFQEVEWKTLDGFLRLRPAEPPDQRILVVGIDEPDIQSIGTYPIPDADFSNLIERLAQDQPRVIGVDILRDFSFGEGKEILRQTFQRHPNVIGIELINGDPVLPPPGLSADQVGFNDLPLDEDGFVRRAFLGGRPPASHPDPDRFRLSFPMLMAQHYFLAQDIPLQNGLQNPDNMRFGDTEFWTLRPNSGGYVGAEVTGLQLLINVRSGRTPFEVVSMTDVMSGQVPPEQIRDRVVIVGITTLSSKDLVNSASVNTVNPGLFYGVEMHAHITSQILSSVLDGRPLLRVLSDPWEYLWIILWGSLGMVLVRFFPRPAWHILMMGTASMVLVILSVGLLWLWGWWIPVMPTLLAFTLNGLVLPAFYLYDQTLRSRIDERQQVIEETYDTIHNGPLQTLALLLRQRDTLDPGVSAQLTNLNQELREIYNHLQQESLPEGKQLQLGNGHIVDLREPLHEVLYEVYIETMERDFPGFDSIRFNVVKFEPFCETGLTIEHKRSLCRLLEEMLCNVGKHAIAAKRLTVLCLPAETHNLIRVEDNGQSTPQPAADPHPTKPAVGGRGTQQADALAKRLGGQFIRTFDNPGTHCEIIWPLHSARRGWRFFFPFWSR